jgi:hypothetical protein
MDYYHQNTTEYSGIDVTSAKPTAYSMIRGVAQEVSIHKIHDEVYSSAWTIKMYNTRYLVKGRHATQRTIYISNTLPYNNGTSYKELGVMSVGFVSSFYAPENGISGYSFTRTEEPISFFSVANDTEQVDMTPSPTCVANYTNALMNEINFKKIDTIMLHYSNAGKVHYWHGCHGVPFYLWPHVSMHVRLRILTPGAAMRNDDLHTIPDTLDAGVTYYFDLSMNRNVLLVPVTANETGHVVFEILTTRLYTTVEPPDQPTECIQNHNYGIVYTHVTGPDSNTLNEPVIVRMKSCPGLVYIGVQQTEGVSAYFRFQTSITSELLRNAHESFKPTYDEYTRQIVTVDEGGVSKSIAKGTPMQYSNNNGVYNYTVYNTMRYGGYVYVYDYHPDTAVPIPVATLSYCA